MRLFAHGSHQALLRVFSGFVQMSLVVHKSVICATVLCSQGAPGGKSWFCNSTTVCEGCFVADVARGDQCACQLYVRILQLRNTGGTIGMLKGEDGSLKPEPGALELRLKKIEELNQAHQICWNCWIGSLVLQVETFAQGGKDKTSSGLGCLGSGKLRYTGQLRCLTTDIWGRRSAVGLISNCR